MRLRLTLTVILAAGALLGACASEPVDGSLSWGGQTQAPRSSGIDAGKLSGSGGAGGTGGATGGGSGGTGGAFAFDAGQTRDVADAAAVVDVAREAVADLRAFESAVSGCHIDIDVTTATTDLDYAPRHVAAIWIANGAGRFVKSVAVWANRRIVHLPLWVGATNAAGVRQNRVDAVTAATLNSHGRRTVTWNCTGVDRMRVADGEYRVCFELNETNGDSVSECVNFTKGPAFQSVTPPDVMAFTRRTLNFYP